MNSKFEGVRCHIAGFVVDEGDGFDEGDPPGSLLRPSWNLAVRSSRAFTLSTLSSSDSTPFVANGLDIQTYVGLGSYHRFSRQVTLFTWSFTGSMALTLTLTFLISYTFSLSAPCLPSWPPYRLNTIKHFVSETEWQQSIWLSGLQLLPLYSRWKDFLALYIGMKWQFLAWGHSALVPPSCDGLLLSWSATYLEDANLS